MSKIPTKSEEVTPEWMQSVLGDDISVETVDVEAGSEKGENFAAQVIRVTVKGMKKGKSYTESFMMKIMPFSEWHREFVMKTHIFEREVCAYKEIFSDFINKQKLQEKVYLSAPKCILAQLDKTEGIIVLEDLKPKGYKMGDIRKGLDIEHCTLAMQEIAKFHAMGYNIKYSIKTPAKQIYPNLYDPLFLTLSDSTFTQMFLDNIKRTKDVLARTDGYETLVTYIETVEGNLMENFRNALIPVEPFSTFCHGDFWNNNMLFRYDEVTGKPVSLKLLDFQVVQYGCPTIDLINFFCSSTTPSLRRESLKELLQLYHNTLFKYLDLFGVTEINRNNFSFSELYRQYYKQSGCYGLMQGMNFTPILLPKENMPDLKDKSIGEMEDLVKSFDKIAEEIMKYDDIKVRLCELVEEMANNGVGL